MLAGMQLDRFTPLKNGPLLATEIATALGVNLQRLEILLYALVRAGLLTVNGGRFGYTPEADAFLVAAARTTSAIVTNCIRIFGTISCQIAGSIRADAPLGKHDLTTMSDAELGATLR
jgi:hypothetical protein